MQFAENANLAASGVPAANSELRETLQQSYHNQSSKFSTQSQLPPSATSTQGQKPLIRLVHQPGTHLEKHGQFGPTTASHSLGGNQASVRQEALGSMSATSHGHMQEKPQF